MIIHIELVNGNFRKLQVMRGVVGVIGLKRSQKHYKRKDLPEKVSWEIGEGLCIYLLPANGTGFI